MATFRIDQATPGAGTPGRSRHDLVPNEVITLVATAPTGPGITYTWEILDKVGSAAVLSSTTGLSVTIGPNTSVDQPSAFLIKLTVNDNGNITEDIRIASVRSLVLGLRVPVFPETAPTTNRLGSNTPDLSTDNALYADRAGLGASGQNWRGWAEWAYELVLACETISGGGASGPASGDLSGTYPAPVVVQIQGRVVVATAPTAGQVYAWNSGLSQWEPTTISGAPSGPASGDLAGSYPGPTVDGLQGVAVSPTAPTNGQVLQYNSGTLQWEPATIVTPTPSNVIVFQPGGTAGGNIYTTWGSFYAAAALISGPVFAIIDSSFSPAQVPTGTYDFSNWRFFGMIPGQQTTLTFMDGAVWALPAYSGKNFEMTDLVFELDPGSTTSMISFAAFASGSLKIVMRNSSLTGLVAHSFIDATANGGGSQNSVRIEAYGPSSLGDYAITLDDTSPGSGSNAFLYLFDRALMTASAITGPSGFLEMHQDNRAATIRYQAGLLAGTQSANGQATPHDWPINESQLGTVELHVGSIYLYTDSILRSTSRAMLGGAVVADTGILKLRRFTGGTLIATWTAAGTLQDTPLGGSDIIIANDDWYDLYLVAGGAAQTALVKGVRLYIHEPGNVSG